MSKPVAATSVKSANNLGLDPTTLEVVIAVRRVDGGLLSEEELAAARAALARVAAPTVTAPRPAAPSLPVSVAQAEEDVAALAPLAAQIRAIATGNKPAAE